MENSVRQEFLKNFDKQLEPDKKKEVKKISVGEFRQIVSMLKYRWRKEAPHLKAEIDALKFEYRKGAWMVKEDTPLSNELEAIVRRDRLL